jgi:predicted nucleic acid-binding protein
VGGNAIRSQALQLLLDDVRAAARTQEDALALHKRLTRTRMRLLGDRVSRARAWRLALEHGWSIAQAEAVALALLQADGFVTVDPTLAAQASTVVPVLPVHALRQG